MYEFSLGPKITWSQENPTRITQIQNLTGIHGFRIPDSPVIFTGGRIWKAEGFSLSEGDKNHLTSNRPFAVVLAIEGTEDLYKTPDQVLRIPMERSTFADTQVSWTRDYARYVAEKLKLDPDKSSIPVATSTFEAPEQTGLVTVTRYREFIKGLGKGGFDSGEHEFDTERLMIDQIPKLVRVLDEISLPSEEYAAWLEQKKIQSPQKSWHRKGDEKCALRGQEWWFNKGRFGTDDDGIMTMEIGQDGKSKQVWKDRLEELQGKVVESEKMTVLFQEIAPNLDYSRALKDMIKNNQKLYLHQNGELDEELPDLRGEQVVTHGTLNPDNIHIQIGSNGEINFVITGGDRSQLYGLRGQQIDWLVSACAASPKHQEALIKAFLDLQQEKGRDMEKEKRGLAMHVMYRSIAEARWFADKGKMDQARNLVKLTCDILQGNGIWKGVNTDLRLTKQ